MGNRFAGLPPLPRLPDGLPEIDVGGVKAKARREARSSALYATIVADLYARLVESSEPADAMGEAIRQAEEVVKVWEEVVGEK